MLDGRNPDAPYPPAAAEYSGLRNSKWAVYKEGRADRICCQKGRKTAIPSVPWERNVCVNLAERFVRVCPGGEELVSDFHNLSILRVTS